MGSMGKRESCLWWEGPGPAANTWPVSQVSLLPGPWALQGLPEGVGAEAGGKGAQGSSVAPRTGFQAGGEGRSGPQTRAVRFGAGPQ